MVDFVTWPPGGASSLRKKHKNVGFLCFQSPRFIVRAFIDSNLILVVIGVTALSDLSLACYNQFFRKSETSKKVSGSSCSALPQQREGKSVVIQTADSHILDIGDLKRETFEKGKHGLTEKMKEVTDASESKEVLSQFQEITVVKDDSLLAKASESNCADCLAFNANDSDVSEESGTTDLPLPPTVLLESGAVQSLMFATEMSELHLGEVERVNEFEADLPRLAVEPISSASSLVEHADVLVGEGEADQVAKSSTNLNGLTLKPASSHVFSRNSNSISSLKQNSDLNWAQLSAKNSLQTAGYAIKRHVS